MSDYKFNCPHCKLSCTAPEELLGKAINCPTCKQSITVPSPNAKRSAPSPAPKQTKQCLFCSEEILISAIKCKHCGEFFDGRKGQSSSFSHTSTPQRIKTAEDSVLTRNRGCVDILIYRVLLLIVLIVAVL